MPSAPCIRSAVVAGGGIAGLSTALALCRAGVEPVVLERAPALTAVGAGITLSPNATRVLERLGVLESVREAGAPLRRGRLRIPRGDTLSRLPMDRHPPGAICVHRADLLEALRSPLPDDAVRLGQAVVSVADEGASVAARLEGGGEVRGEVLVAADGIRSRTRQDLLGDGPPVYRGYVAWRGLTQLPGGVEEEEAVETLGDGLRFGYLACGRGRLYWYATADRPRVGGGRSGEAARSGGGPGTREGFVAADPEIHKAELLRLFHGWHPPIPEILETTPADAILEDGVHDRDPRRPWSRGRIVLVGDAAHPTTPNQGQGGCMALEDADALAWFLADSPDPQTAFARFEAERWPRTRRIVLDSRFVGRIGQASGWRARLRDAVMRRVPPHLLAARGDRVFGYRGPGDR